MSNNEATAALARQILSLAGDDKELFGEALILTTAIYLLIVSGENIDAARNGLAAMHADVVSHMRILATRQ